MKRLLFSLFLMLGAWLPGGAVHAGTCTWSMADVVHGTIDVTTGVPADTTSPFSMNCTGWTPSSQILVCLSFGWTLDYRGSCNGNTRNLGPGGSTGLFVNQFFQDSAHSVVWGDSRCGPTTAYEQFTLTTNTAGTASGAGTIYSRMLAGQQTLVPGTYTGSMFGDGMHWYAKQKASSADTCTLNTAAETQGPGFNMSAVIAPVCTILSASTMDFGTSGLITGKIDTSSTLSLRCTNTTPYGIALDGGLATATDPTQRKMKQGSNAVVYGLYLDNARSQPWGSTSGSNTQAGTGSGFAQAYTVYGRVAPQTTPPPGTYTDTVVVTVTY